MLVDLYLVTGRWQKDLIFDQDFNDFNDVNTTKSAYVLCVHQITYKRLKLFHQQILSSTNLHIGKSNGPF